MKSYKKIIRKLKESWEKDATNLWRNIKQIVIKCKNIVKQWYEFVNKKVVRKYQENCKKVNEIVRRFCEHWNKIIRALNKHSGNVEKTRTKLRS